MDDDAAADHRSADDAVRVDLDVDPVARARMVDAATAASSVRPSSSRTRRRTTARRARLARRRLTVARRGRTRTASGLTIVVVRDVGEAEEARDVLVERVRPELVRRRDLHDLPVAHHRHAVAERERLV